MEIYSMLTVGPLRFKFPENQGEEVNVLCNFTRDCVYSQAIKVSYGIFKPINYYLHKKVGPYSKREPQTDCNDHAI